MESYKMDSFDFRNKHGIIACVHYDSRLLLPITITIRQELTLSEANEFSAKLKVFIASIEAELRKE